VADPASLLAIASAGLAAIALASGAALRMWRGWLELKRLEIAAGSGPAPDLGDLRARVRRLEAIAEGE
jgi:hypothetical protein